ncbi:MAG: ABC transporter ATP-binding protein [archaeon GB-1867-035]|nr:ABC transporter ATP-binding protein [Candidatus Culexmicrobium profundum]
MDLNPVINVENVSKSFIVGRSLGRNTFLGEAHWIISLIIRVLKEGRILRALKDINLNVNGGELCCILGPNGSGKSTLLKIIAGMIEPDKGNVRVYGFNPITERSKVLDKIFFYSSSQRYSLDYSLTVRDQIEFYLKMLGRSASILDEKAQLCIKFLDLERYLKTPIRFLSSGYRQRVSLTRLLLTEKELILLDEPTLGLDPTLNRRLILFLKKLNKEKNATIIIATNRVHLVEELEPDKVFILSKGELIAEGSPSYLISLIRDKYVIKIEVANVNKNVIREIKSLDGISDVSIKMISNNRFEIAIFTNTREIFKEVYDFVVAKGLHIQDMYLIEPSFEDVYLKLTGGDFYFEQF